MERMVLFLRLWRIEIALTDMRLASSEEEKKVALDRAARMLDELLEELL
jgi:hypothetical protein